MALVAPSMSALVPAYRALLSVGVDRQAVHRASVHPPFVLTSDNDGYFVEGLDA